MELKHLNVSVSDVGAVTAFFETFFGLRCVEAKGGVIAVLEDDAGFVLVLSNLEKGVTYTYPRDFHIGFYVDSPDIVNALYARLNESVSQYGLTFEHAPKTLRGAWTFYCRAFDTLMIEVTAR